MLWQRYSRGKLFMGLLMILLLMLLLGLLYNLSLCERLIDGNSSRWMTVDFRKVLP